MISNALKRYFLHFGGSLTKIYKMRTMIFVHNIHILSNTYFPIFQRGVATPVTTPGSATECDIRGSLSLPQNILCREVLKYIRQQDQGL